MREPQARPNRSFPEPATVQSDLVWSARPSALRLVFVPRLSLLHDLHLHRLHLVARPSVPLQNAFDGAAHTGTHILPMRLRPVDLQVA